MTRLNKANISITFNQLDELILCGLLDENIVRFVSKHPIISKFIFKSYDPSAIDKKVLHQLTKALQSVKELRFDWCSLSADSVFEFMSECHSLKYLEFCFYGRADHEALEDSLGTEWRSTITSIAKYTSIVKLER